MASQRFHLGDLLSISTGTLMPPNGMDGVYQVLNYLTGDNLFTHQLPAASEAVKDNLLQQLPFLADITCPPALQTLEEITGWLDYLVAEYGEYHEISPAPRELWGLPHNPLADLIDMVGPDRVLVVDTSPSQEN